MKSSPPSSAADNLSPMTQPNGKVISEIVSHRIRPRVSNVTHWSRPQQTTPIVVTVFSSGKRSDPFDPFTMEISVEMTAQNPIINSSAHQRTWAWVIGVAAGGEVQGSAGMANATTLAPAAGVRIAADSVKLHAS
jgi:hypothetical protein